MTRTIAMSEAELKRKTIIEQAESKRITQREGAEEAFEVYAKKKTDSLRSKHKKMYNSVDKIVAEKKTVL